MGWSAASWTGSWPMAAKQAMPGRHLMSGELWSLGACPWSQGIGASGAMVMAWVVGCSIAMAVAHGAAVNANDSAATKATNVASPSFRVDPPTRATCSHRVGGATWVIDRSPA